MPKFYDERALAEALLVNVATLRNWRYMGKGPKFVKLGGAVRYREEDVNAWIEVEANKPRRAA